MTTITPENITDVEPITAENASSMLHQVEGIVKSGPTETIVQPSQEQIMAYMQHLRKMHNAKCRKKGFKDHIHQPAGHKLQRKLARQGSLYGRLSLVGEMMKDIQLRKFKEARDEMIAKAESIRAKFLAGIPHQTNTTNPIDFPRENHATV